MELGQLLREIKEDGLIKASLSSPAEAEGMEKVQIRPVRIKNRDLWQITVFQNSQVFHSNCGIDETMEKIAEWTGAPFRQVQLESIHYRGTVLTGKKGTVTVKKKRKGGISESRATMEKPVLSHNRMRNYIIQEGIPADFLVELSVMTKEGIVVKSRYDKFRQINRFLEFIDDVLPSLPDKKELRIIDFGCGKSYLTFAMYYYLHERMGLNITVTGLDLKAEVIHNCSVLAQKLGYDKLHFKLGDIAGYKDDSGADMVVTLHACDTATDYALAQAVRWGASVILAVPCCQHEVNRQIHCKELAPVLEYGIIKERLSALVTDVMRAQLLKEQGYDTQILEFIDMEHTPKNLLIRAVKRKGMQPAAGGKKSERLDEFLQLDTTLQKLLRS